MMSITTNAYQVSNSLLVGHHLSKYFANLKRGEFTSYAKGEFFYFVIGSAKKGDIEFCQFTKKGSTLNASLSSNGNQKKDGVGIFYLFVQRRLIVSYSFDCLALRCLRLISALAAEIKKPAVLSPSTFNVSINSKSSKGSLTDTCSDLLFFLPVAITESPLYRWCSVYTKLFHERILTWCSPLNILVVFTYGFICYRNSNASKCGNTIEAFNHNVIRGNTMAMYKSTQTRPKFLWRFFSCQQFKYFIVIASSEQEARSMLPDSPCLFSARFAEGESV
ncbi:hypothetical protein HMPREF1567_0761 [Providencia alcalifaciens PAL-2]|nr:host cell division inhibitor Icd-like protein [Providencia alcalifaciens]ETT03703.1 hypothetical protein HMPREF1562_3633 [Providencia alcalifaciens F90-2004]EUC94057.1 hypothetical protein HMPREF1567_0761 [Providencia alcalifaciens PAL-2]